MLRRREAAGERSVLGVEQLEQGADLLEPCVEPLDPGAAGRDVEAERGDADALAELVLEGESAGFDLNARAHGGGVVITGRDAGGGPGAEATARALTAVGVRVVVAWSFAPEGRRVFAQHGLLPLTWRRAEESAGLRPGDVLELSGLPECLLPHAPIELRNLTSGLRHDFDHGLGAADLDVLVAGGLLRWAADAALAPSA